MTEQWQELKENIIEMRDNDETGTQQEVCKFLANLMDVLEKQMQEPCEDIAQARYKDLQDYFGNGEVAKFVLENQKEFKMWLERMRWNTKKVDELARELETLKQEPCGDAISRQSVVDTTLNSKSSFKNDFACGFFIDKIRELTPVTPQEPRTGRWINIKDISWKGGGYWQCPNCKNGFAYDAYFEADEWGYCPKCGARMQEVEENG